MTSISDNKHIKVWVQEPTLGVDHNFRAKGFTVQAGSRDWAAFDPDLLVFCGGSDISPKLYGQNNVRSSCHVARDNVELELFTYGTEKHIPMIGICRGAQLLNVLSGGSMWQDVIGHANGRCVHEIVDARTGKLYNTNSHHHQGMRPAKNAEVIAYTKMTTGYKIDDTGTYKKEELSEEDQRDYEVLFYENTQSLCWQGHPEFNTMPKDGDLYFWSLVKEKFECVV